MDTAEKLARLQRLHSFLRGLRLAQESSRLLAYRDATRRLTRELKKQREEIETLKKRVPNRLRIINNEGGAP